MKIKYKNYLLAITVILIVIFGAVAHSGNVLQGRFSMPINFTTIDTDTKPNLKITDISVSGTGQLQITQKNASAKIVTEKGGTTAIYFDGTLRKTYNWSTLADQSFRSITGQSTIYTDVLDGIYTVEACIDASNLVEESNETDNCMTATAGFKDGFIIYETTNVEQGLEWFDENREEALLEGEDDSKYLELQGTVMAIESDDVIVLIPEGYEELGIAHAKDLTYCLALIPTTFDHTYPSEKVLAKRYINEADVPQNFSSHGQIFSSRIKSNLDGDLEDVLTNDPEGSLYASSPSSCSNSHEFTHTLFYEAPTAWATEGFAQYSQKLHQSGSNSALLECYEDGYTDENGEWTEYATLLADDIDYDSSMCLVELIDEIYGRSALLAIADRLEMFQNGTLTDTISPYYHFVYDVLDPVIGEENRNYLLEIFGICGEEGFSW
ncbi:MAG: CARDB domain-containing protein [Candidatus Gracilibacteria bacterium]